jgi:hypothetical protein
MSDARAACKNCGAPHTAGYASCRYCKTPFVDDLATQAIPCPQCHTYSEWGAQKCVQCGAWIVVQCVFCSALSPNHVPACLSCHEPFAGAPERLAARRAEQQRQQTLQTVSTVGSVAATFLGAVAGAALEGDHHHHHHASSSSWLGDAVEAVTESSGDGGGLLDELLGES